MATPDRINANPDIDRWNKKYDLSAADGSQTDSQIMPKGEDELVALRPYLESDFSGISDLSETTKIALEVASGKGRNALYLASIGYRVIAVDCALNGLVPGQSSAKRLDLPMNSIACDLETCQFPQHSFDLVSVIRFLKRPLFEVISAWVKPGGLLFYKTFNRDHLLSHPKFNSGYVVETGELNTAFPDFEIRATDYCSGGTAPLISGTSFILGRKKLTVKSR